ncbi:MAG TPA: hypothetical protein VH251_07860, partial [Verrucomicrobiae bacterium]|nr:hypothetical protein [Verrucomicrobiae bacterium]
VWQKMVVLVVPCACFLAGFAPYWAVAHREIIQHVFCYETVPGGFIYKYFIPQCIQFCWDSRTVWYGLLILFAFICRARNGFESLLIYTAVLVVFSPYLNNSYLVIVMALAAVYPNALFLIYMATSAFCIWADYRNGPRVWMGLETRHDDFATYLLFFSLCWLLWRAKFLQLFQRVRQEIRIQFGLAE